jgi:hypothetical protein
MVFWRACRNAEAAASYRPGGGLLRRWEADDEAEPDETENAYL